MTVFPGNPSAGKCEVRVGILIAKLETTRGLAATFTANAISRWDTENSVHQTLPAAGRWPRALKFGFISARYSVDKGEPVLI